MEALTLTLLASMPQLLTGLIQGGFGFLQPKPERPTMSAPASATAALNNAEMMAKQTRLPGQSSIEGRLDRVTANELSMLERLGDSPTSVINSASRAYGNQLDRETELGIKGAEFQNRNQINLINEQNRMANWEQKAWEWNEADKYKTKSAELSALKEAGITNFAGGAQDLVGNIGLLALAGKLGNGDAGTDKGSVDWLKSIKEGATKDGSLLSKSLSSGNASFENSSTPEERRLMELMQIMGQ